MGMRKVVVELTEREAFALVVGVGLAAGRCKAAPAKFSRMVGGSLLRLRGDGFVGAAGFQADALAAGHKLWLALGLPP